MVGKNLRTYVENSSLKSTREEPEASHVACDEKDCKGEMMITVPHIEHYSVGRPGEAGAIKTELLRASCGECGWLGWV